MRQKIYIAVLAIFLVVFAFSCKSSSEVTQPDTNTNQVSVRDNSFSPSTITVPAGTTVTWTHNASTVHTVTSGNRPNASGLYDSGDMNNGSTFQFTFSTPGTYPYFCMYHNGMNGTVVVQ